MLAEVVKLDTGNLLDVPAGLRELADNIERGAFDDAHNLAWVIDGGNGRIHVGLLGAAAEYGPTAYLLHGLAMHKIAAGSLE